MEKITPKDDLDVLQAESATIVGDLLADIAAASISKNKAAENKATVKLGEVIRRTNGIADLLGRKRTLQAVDPDPKQFAAEITPASFSLQTAYDVPFEEAAQAILEGQVFQNLPMSQLKLINSEVTRVYGEHANLRSHFGIMDAKVDAIRRANEILHNAVMNGVPTQQATADMKAAMGPWSKATGETIYRTQVSKAYSAGQWRQIEDPIISNRVGAVQFVSSTDSNTRPMHKAINGFLAGAKDSIWQVLTPPLHFNCRCGLLFHAHDVLKRMGQLDRNGKLKPQRRPVIPKPNFGKRPDKTVYAHLGAA